MRGTDYSKGYYKKFLTGIGDAKGGLSNFLKENFWLIVNEARNRYGNNFNLDEVISDAANAYYNMRSYHKRTKNTKETTSFTWFLKKQFDKSSGFSVLTHSRGNKNLCSRESGAEKDTNEVMFDRYSYDAFLGNEESPFEREEQCFHGFSELEPSEIEEGTEAEGENKKPSLKRPASKNTDVILDSEKYRICIESFKGHLSHDLYKLLRSLSGKRMRYNRRKAFDTDNSLNQSHRFLRSKLFYEISQAGYSLYVGICLNGICSNVLVAARCEAEAKKYLKRYGNLIEIRCMEVVASMGAPALLEV